MVISKRQEHEVDFIGPMDCYFSNLSILFSGDMHLVPRSYYNLKIHTWLASGKRLGQVKWMEEQYKHDCGRVSRTFVSLQIGYVLNVIGSL